MFLICAILFLFFIYCKIFINYKIRISKGLCLNASRLTPCLIGTKMPYFTLSPLKTLVLISNFFYCLENSLFFFSIVTFL